MKTVDHVVLIALVLFVSLLLLFYSVSPLAGSVLYFALPSAYLFFRKPDIGKRALLPALLFGLLFGVGFEYLNEVGGSWIFPLESSFAFPSFFFGIVPLDVMVWYILWVFTVICYYEYLTDRPLPAKIAWGRVHKLLVVAIAALSIIAVAEFIVEKSIVIPFAYTVTGIASLLPVWMLYKRKPDVFPKLAQTIPFLALFFLIMEAVALSVGYWEFVGGSLLTMTIAGHLVPTEEIVFWILASPLIISSYHELTIEN